MIPLTQDVLIQMVTNFVFYFIIATFGAFLKDLYEKMTKENDPIRLGEILIGGASAAFIIYGIEDLVLKDLSINLIVLLTFICGILGFELFGELTSISKVQDLINLIIEIKKGIHIEFRKNDNNTAAEEKKKMNKKKNK